MSTKLCHIWQLDVLKALAIFSVLLLHTLPRKLLYISFAQFHIWQAVLVFMIIMGFTYTMSFYRHLSWKIFIYRRLFRILLPVIVLFLFSIFYGLIFKVELTFDKFTFLGLGPIRGPGSYFIAIAIESIIVIPIIAVVVSQIGKKLNLNFLIFVLVVVNIDIEIFCKIFNIKNLTYSCFILRYFLAICFGILYVFYKDKILKTYAFKIGFVISLFWLLLWGIYRFEISLFPNEWGWQHVFPFFYSFFLVYIGLNHMPKVFNKKIIILIGKASYHIFLFQILFFGLDFKKKIYYLILSYFPKSVAMLSAGLVCLSGGIIWFWFENKILRGGNK